MEVKRWRACANGSSLVIVLFAIVLLSILLLAFLATVRTEVQTSKVYSTGASLNLLANTAVNIVEGQVRVATGDPVLNWASQPGMIRTYNTSGSPAGFFKLYSDGSMQGTGQFDHANSANAVATDWYSQRGIYTDLNQPIRVGGTNYYPILSGDASDLTSFTSTLAGTVKTYGPITGGVPAVEGFWIKNAPVDPSSPNQAPMPVKWLYVLQDGKILVPKSSSAGVVSFDSAGILPSATNQIVGRIAFWADDETSKVNVNTASEGTFWDTPRSYNVQDYYLATRQPVQGEFQRYPGHPATVSLSSVLGLGLSGASWTPNSPVSHLSLEEVYPITPATKAGGSQGGNVDTAPTSNILPASVNRLYGTVDEFLFQPGLDSSKVRKRNASLLTSASSLSPEVIRKGQFFLTANSQAPDVSIFNLPRVSMWPITLDRTTAEPATSPFDKLISFCSTVNSHIFYFQRQDPNSSTVDLPESGASTGLGRNRQLLDYLRQITALPAPGFGGNLATKYGDDNRQILIEAFDYIRATNLQDSTTGATPYAKALTSSAADGEPGRGQVIPIVDRATTVTDSVSSKSTHPRGFGRFPTVQQAFLVFIGAGNNSSTYFPNVVGYPGFSSYSFPTITDANTQRVQAGFFLQMYDPSSGTPFAYPWYEIEVAGLDSMEWSNDSASSYSMGFASSGTIRPSGAASLSPALYGGISDYRILTVGKSNALSSSRYPFITCPTGAQVGNPAANVGSPDMNNGQIFFKGGKATVKIFALDTTGKRASSDPVQVVDLSFPSGTFPLPETVADSTGVVNPSPGNYNFRSFYDNGVAPFGRLNYSKNYSWISSRDVVRAIVATPGDVRLMAARYEVSSDFFKPLPNAMTGSEYASQTERHSHMLRFGLAFPVYGAAGGRLVNYNYSNYLPKYDIAAGQKINDAGFWGGSYYRSKDMSVPTLTGVTTASGVAPDWDNGIGNNVDGPFINKPDEGDAGRNDPNGRPYYELDYGSAVAGDTFFSPNRMLPSPGMLGSLPTGVLANKPWQTLLFRPGPSGHPGLASSSGPPDHLFLDMFNMPVVEPYAISTPLATSGRINMNHLIVPFSYINRDTGLRAAMKSQMVTAINGNYKTYQNPNGTPTSGNKPSSAASRFPVDADKTLSQFAARFSTGDIFRSASEICSVDLVPVNSSAPALPITRANMDNFWAGFPITGDNVRERPYANLYPLLTTRSNTYTVHYRVQSLKQTTGGDYTTWREGLDTILGQSRGSRIIERYIDPNDSIPDYVTIVGAGTYPPAKPLGDFYKFRVIATRQFAP